ncbi:MAG: DegV family protein [Acidimicrobiales bacterium]|jgi:DegV family protein with EDD domain
MARVRVVTDSAGDLTPALAEERGIFIVPLSIRFGSEEFVDGATLSSDEFWRRCKSSEILPETSAPSPGAFQEAFTRAAGDGYDGIVCINLSGALSATYQSAKAAADAVSDQVQVRVIDSRSVTMGQGLIALAAAESAAGGASLDEVEAVAQGRIERTLVFGAIDTLEHLEKGGRIGGARALLGSLLSIKPVVQVVDGVVEEESKQRTRSRQLKYLADKVHGMGGVERVAICNGAANDLEDLLRLLGEVDAKYPLEVVNLGPVVGTHTGPGTIGVCVVTLA